MTAPHGTTTTYFARGCRCEDCRTAARRYNKRLKLDQYRGVSRLVDATPAREHVAALLAGVFADDALVVTVNAEKHWCDNTYPVPGAWVQVRSVVPDRLSTTGSWRDPAPRVLGPVMVGQPEDPGVRCSCGAPWLASVSHSAAVCSGPEAS